jgi:peptide/nickel transport system permease protein
MVGIGKTLKNSPTAALGLAIVIGWVLVAVLAPVLPLYDPNALMEPFKTPFAAAADGGTCWLGTDHKGRDLLARIVFGARRVLIWGGTATLAAYALGTVLGLVAGYLGGLWDDAVGFVANTLLSFPVIVLYVLIIASLGAGGISVVLAVAAAMAPIVMRIVRAEVRRLRPSGFVRAAEMRGESRCYVMFVEILPNLGGAVLADACLRFGYVVITVALLGYLGLGLPPPDPDWGKMIAETQPLGSFAGHMAVLPALALSSLVLGVNLLADGLRRGGQR